MIDDIIVSKAILERYHERLMNGLEVDVAIAGAGPAGLTAAYYLAKEGVRTAVFERKLSVGGGMWGGGIMFNEIVVQDRGMEILDEIGVRTRPYDDGYHTADSVESVTGLCYKAIQAGATVFNLISAEDVLIDGPRVTGLVINWTSVEMANLHVDPITMRSKYVIDATGHASEVITLMVKKDLKLNTPSGGLEGEKSMNAEIGEAMVVANTKEVYPGVYVSGMAANAVYGSPRMGPIFGGMLLSGKYAAEQILEKL